MASEEIRKKWGTIFMGDREASVEQLNAMQEPLRREKQQKEQAEDYMERVRARAADRAREILGAAYTERQKVLEEARLEIVGLKRKAMEECARLKSEGDAARKLAEAELSRAEEEKSAAVKIREAAHAEGFQAGMEQAGAELHEFRAELGQSVANLMRSIERERKKILQAWRDDLATVTRCAVQAGTGMILEKEHDAILSNLVFRALDLLENRSLVTLRVNPADEAAVADMFRAARQRAPELKQWIVTGDPAIEPGGIVADSGSGSVDLQRGNFQELVDGILCHLGLPDQETPEEVASMRDLVEREVAHIASMTPEMDQGAQPEIAEAAAVQPEEIETQGDIPKDSAEPEDVIEPVEDDEIQPSGPQLSDDLPQPGPQESEVPESDTTSLADLEEELFPLGEEQAPQAEELPDAKTLAEGGFL